MSQLGNKKVGKVLSVVTALALLLCIFAVNPVQALQVSDANEAILNLSRTVPATTQQLNRQFNVTYTINPDPVQGSVTSSKAKEFYLVIDTSGSMNYDLAGNQYSSNTKRLAIAKEAAKKFIDKLSGVPNVKAGLITYDNVASKKCDLTSNLSTVKTAINNLSANGGTNIGDGLRYAYYRLSKSESSAEKYIILLTDGQPTYHSITKDPEYDSWGRLKGDYPYMMTDGIAQKYKGGGSYATDNDKQYSYKVAEDLIKTSGIKTYMIAFTIGSDQNILSEIAEKAGGTYKQALDAEALNEVYNEISEDIINDFSLQNVSFEETFPAGISVVESDYGLKVEGQKVSGNLPSVNYHLNKSTNRYEASPIEFSITLMGDTPGDYVLGAANSSKLSYEDVNGSTKRLYFSELNIRIEGVQAPITLNKSLSSNEVNLNEEVTASYQILPQPMEFLYSGNSRDKEIVLVFDTSSSMEKKLDGNTAGLHDQTREQIAKEAAVSFIDKLEGVQGVKVALVSFSSGATIRRELTSDLDAIRDEINSLPTMSGTNIGGGLRLAYYILKDGKETSDKYIILLTDGEPSSYTTKNRYTEEFYLESEENGGYNKSYYEKEGTQYAEKVVDALINTMEINNYFISFSSKINVLETLADRAGGQHRTALDAEALNKVYESISKTIESDFTVRNVQFTEVFPEGITIGNVPDDFTVSGQTVTGNLGDITYKYNESSGKYVAPEIEFSIKLNTPTAGDYTIGKDESSYIVYKDLNEENTKKCFEEIGLIVKGTEEPEIPDEPEVPVVPDFEVVGFRKVGENVRVEVNITVPSDCDWKLVDASGKEYTLSGNEVIALDGVNLSLYQTYDGYLWYELSDGSTGTIGPERLFNGVNIN